MIFGFLTPLLFYVNPQNSLSIGLSVGIKLLVLKNVMVFGHFNNIISRTDSRNHLRIRK